MNVGKQHIEITVKKLGLVTFLVGGLAVHAFAQATPISLPKLPALPSVPVPSIPGQNPPQNVNNATISPVASLPTPAAAAGALPLVPPVPMSPTAEAPAAEPSAMVQGLSSPPATIDSALPPLAGTAEPLPTVPLPSGLPPISGTLPEINVSVPDALPVPSAAPLESAEELGMPRINVIREKAPPKTWETNLAPTVVPLTTKYNYKRQLLPETIYRREYSVQNRHLPRRVNREDYERLLFANIARHNLEAVRALLNAGTYIDAVNGYGETPRMYAERIGATDAAALLAARGGR